MQLFLWLVQQTIHTVCNAGKGKKFPVEDLQAFIGLNIAMDLLNLPLISDYWSKCQAKFSSSAGKAKGKKQGKISRSSTTLCRCMKAKIIFFILTIIIPAQNCCFQKECIVWVQFVLNVLTFLDLVRSSKAMAIGLQ